METDGRHAQVILTHLNHWTPNMWHSDQPISNTLTRKIASEAMSKNIF